MHNTSVLCSCFFGRSPGSALLALSASAVGTDAAAARTRRQTLVALSGSAVDTDPAAAKEIYSNTLFDFAGAAGEFDLDFESFGFDSSSGTAAEASSRAAGDRVGDAGCEVGSSGEEAFA